MKALFIIDMQNDFIDGVLGNPEAQAIVPKVIKKIEQFKQNGNIIVTTQDTHTDYYLTTEEGKHLPILHCLHGTEGWEIREDILLALNNRNFSCLKESFGYPWPNGSLIKDITEIEIVGLDTDFCVLANAMTLKAAFPNVPITIDAACCAGSTPEWHEKALDMLEHCHFNIINRKKENKE